MMLIMSTAPALKPPPVSRRDQQKEQTRLDLARAAFELAQHHGLAGVRVPQVAAAVGVSPRTFNNYFPSKEAAIVWPTTFRAAQLASHLADRPAEEPLAQAIVAAVTSMYGEDQMDVLPAGWLQGLRALVATEPALHGEYLKAAAAAESALAEAIARRIGVEPGHLEPMVLAAVTAGAERAAVLYWARHSQQEVPLAELVRAAVDMAIRGTGFSP